MQTWHDGLQSELPVFVALPRRPGMRVNRSTLTAQPQRAPGLGKAVDRSLDRLPIEIVADSEA